MTTRKAFLHQIKIGSIDTGKFPQKLDHILKIELENELNPYAKAKDSKYLLDIIITRANTSFGTKSDSSSTRMLITFTLHFSLKDLQTSKTLYTDTVLSYDSFQITESPYSTFISEEENMNRIAKASVNEIKIRLLSFFIDSQDATES